MATTSKKWGLNWFWNKSDGPNNPQNSGKGPNAEEKKAVQKTTTDTANPQKQTNSAVQKTTTSTKPPLKTSTATTKKLTASAPTANTTSNTTSAVKPKPTVNEDAKATNIKPIVENPIGVPSLVLAKQTLSEIEAMIQKELSLLASDNFDEDSDSSPVRKRPGPKLIRPVNKKKNKMVVGDMYFDPVRNLWVGNEEELDIFQRATPALITNMTHQRSQPQVIGDMIFDPEEQVWRGNEKDLKKFSQTIGLISQLTPTTEPIINNGMVFDPDTMTWRGNEEVEDIFDEIEDLDAHKSFSVQDEFIISPETIKLFHEYQEQHTAALKGWLGQDEDKTGREHLFYIRNMSIMRVIHQARAGLPSTNANKNKPIIPGTASATLVTLMKPSPAHDPIMNSPSRMSSMDSGGEKSPKQLNKSSGKTVNNMDEDWDEIEIPLGVKLSTKLGKSTGKASSDEDWGEISESDNNNAPRGESSDKPNKKESTGFLSKFQDAEEDDGFGDIEIIDTKRVVRPMQRTMSTDSNLSTNDSLSLSRASSASKLGVSSGEEEEEIYSGIQNLSKLKQRLPRGVNTIGKKLGSFIIDENEIASADDEVVLSEDWSDVEFPSFDTMKKRLSSKPANSNNNTIAAKTGLRVVNSSGSITNLSKALKEENAAAASPQTAAKSTKTTVAASEDEWSGIDVPEQQPLKLVNRHRRASSSDEQADLQLKNGAAEDEDWSDIEMPNQLVLKSASNVNSQPRPLQLKNELR